MTRSAERAAWTAHVTGEAQAKPSKYSNLRTGKYASKKEAAVATKLWALARAGQIQNLEEQVLIELVPGDGKIAGVSYRADFCYDDGTGHHVIDVKGGEFRTAIYKIKKRLAWLLKRILIEEV